MKKKKNFLVTGGTGFIGSNICRFLIKKKYKVSVLDNNFRGNLKKINDIKKKITFIKGDIRNNKLVNKSLKNVDAVVHLAYINGTRNFYEKPVDVLDIAVKGIVNILDGCVKNNIKEIYLASSSEVYQTPHKIPTTEDEMLKIPDIHNPRYSYGGGKILTELMGINYGKKFFKKLIIFRPHNVYGPDMGNEHVIPEFIKKITKIKKNKKLVIKGSGNESRSFVYIDDFINAFELLIKKGKHLNIYNLGTDHQVKIKKVADLIGKILQKKISLKKGLIAKGGTTRRCPDISKIKKLGFKSKTTLKNGLKKTVSWYLKN